MKADGLIVNAGAGCYTVYANDRALFAETPVVIMNDGRMYIPASIFAKATGMRLTDSEERIKIEGSYSPRQNNTRRKPRRAAFRKDRGRRYSAEPSSFVLVSQYDLRCHFRQKIRSAIQSYIGWKHLQHSRLQFDPRGKNMP
jgi:hypothetical protein